MNTTTPYAASPERRQASRRTFHPALGITPWNTLERSTYNREFFLDSLTFKEIGQALIERRNWSDRRLAAHLKRLLPALARRRIALVVGLVLIFAVGLPVILSQKGTDLANPHTSYTPERAQYQWHGFHRVPLASYFEETPIQSAFPT